MYPEKQVSGEKQTGKTFRWIHTFTQNKEEMKEVSKKHKIPDYVIESAGDPNEVPRREHWDINRSQIPDLLILKYPYKIQGDLGYEEYVTLPLTIITLEETVLTFSQTEVLFLTDFPEKNIFSSEIWDRDYFILSLIWKIGAEYIDCLTEINERVAQ